MTGLPMSGNRAARVASMAGLALLLAACTGISKAYAPDGKVAYVVECGVALQSLCYSRALEACPGGYRLLDAGQAPSYVVNYRGQTTVFHGAVQMWVRCKSDE